ncbi:hypothetical protein [Streptomonospora litoralis]|uniref:Uncharacterized protein n=1 Tax=Streptomonospora litoralis TaxID=2498135 RepID=A0A4P6QAN3_9ACTN|nr:hypothetical protein [Streptomonospora litoralis]QBI56821.1 hypothetical protein EKD16_25405 [Streptomonospora litoralis]
MSVTFFPEDHDEDGPDLAVSNANAATLLRLLGLRPEQHADAPDAVGPLGIVLHDELAGIAPAEDILGRVLTATALLDVATDDANGRPMVRDGNVIDCGRRPGYLAERLQQLAEVAAWARDHGAAVVWA